MSQREITAIEASVARTLRSSVAPLDPLDIARSLVRQVISAYWKETEARLGGQAELREMPSEISLAPLEPEVCELAQKMGTKAAELDVLDASYRIGVLYTGLMPDERQARLGAHYTPRALCQRLLDMAEDAGTEWDTARVLDPACGGGAFLSPLALRMAASLKDQPAETVLTSIEQRLRGYEIDSFAAWMSEVFLDVILAELCLEAGRPLKSLVQVCDALEQEPGSEKFDLVIGNPPYGRITLSPNLRQRFQRSLFGHANLYGVFADLALRFTSSSGVIAYVTPTSFLSGEYFKGLRVLLGWEAPPVSIDFIAERKGVFADVLQETMLATYQHGREPGAVSVHFLTQDQQGSVKITGAGSFNLSEELDRPWLIPRSDRQSELVGRVSRLPYRLADYGYKVSTGPLVWNRHKSGLRDEPGEGRYPLLWAESVRSNGVFEFRAQKRNHKPYFQPAKKEHWVVTDHPCVLLQRTTAKEQCRRLIAAELPEQFIRKHGAVVVENHLNMIKPLNGTPKVSAAALAALLNSDVVDQVFRCINGSVAVSAYELQALPLPSPDDVKDIEELIETRARREAVEQAIEHLYGGEAK
ncbi:MAG: Eco57I restriction-modification methylase domain-containing protein [Gammaproteobacteria bacterium]|nr:Eco57I restriction-modification methylase domain-containing protein [Gammaproteobacteria bacterium]MXW45019.1 N-6 DNA methylase [Gammaproteobacteria bacterium]MYD01675.1 N-6 DNA methylase [Gammaproteobacteria bacterium]MYI25113.1 N-6 DNA methylase [Gammaproteobacteria bacterium]